MNNWRNFYEFGIPTNQSFATREEWYKPRTTLALGATNQLLSRRIDSDGKAYNLGKI